MNVCNLKQLRTRGREAGFTLAEMLIAMAIFIIAATVAFLLYDNAQRSFKRGEEATEQQQVTRVAFDKLLADLRMAGFNFNPTGNTNRTDEQIEGAWSMAVSLRADFDFEDPIASADPEDALNDGVFNVVSTGNDEIVTYALAKDSGNVGGDTLTFFADTSDPRDDLTPDQVDINNVALLAQDDPPYTLYRITLDASGDAVKEPLADNLRSMSFTYYDANATLLNPSAMEGGEANRDTRAKIRRITVQVEGMTPNDDIHYTDPADSDPDTLHRRKFDLVSDVQPRNLGLVGAADVDNVAPTTPTGFGTCEGHCGGMVLDWTENDVSESVVVYNIKYGTSPTSMNSVVSSAAPPAYASGLIDTSTYYFAIQAQDVAGNKSPWSSTISTTLSSDTVPEQVQNLAAAVNGVDIDLSWDGVSTNTSSGASADPGGCDPGKPVRRDSGGYKVYRKTAPSGTFNLSDAETSFTASSNTYTDNNAALCVGYGYRVTAIDAGCSSPLEGAPSNMVTAETESLAPLQAPTNTVAEVTGGAHAALSWTAVTQDTATPTPNTVLVESYNVYEALVNNGDDPAAATYSLLTGGNLSCSALTTCQHNNGAAGTSATVIRYYKVAAATACDPPDHEGILSAPFPLTCEWGTGGITFITPTDGAEVVAGTASIRIAVSASASTPQTAVFTVLDASTSAQVGSPLTDSSYSASSPNFEVTWNAGGLSGAHKIIAAVTLANNCTRTTEITVNVVTPVPCCLSVSGAVVIPTGANNKKLDVTFSNFCGVDLTAHEFQAQAVDVLNNGTKISSAAFDTSSPFFSSGPGENFINSPFVTGISPAAVLVPDTHHLITEYTKNISDCAGSNDSFEFFLRYTRPETGIQEFECLLDIDASIVQCE